METIQIIVIVFLVAVTFHFIRFKLTKWEKLVEKFGSEKRSDLKPIYGFWSEYKSSRNSYPLGNALLKVSVTSFGLYLQYDLKFEPIKFYKPVMIPWEIINVRNTEESTGKGCDEFILANEKENFGILYLQIAVSDTIKESAEKLGVELNFV